MLNLEVLFLIEYSYGREPFCILLSQIFSQIWGFALHMAADTSAGGCEPAWGADAGRSEKKNHIFRGIARCQFPPCMVLAAENLIL